MITFNIDFSESVFIFISLCIFTFWAIMAIYRYIREELKYRNIPWVWGAFVIFLMMYVAGAVYNFPYRGMMYVTGVGYDFPYRGTMTTPYILTHYLFTAFFIGGVSTYVTMFDITSFTRYRMIWDSFKNNNFKKVMESIPKWVVSFVITVTAGVFLFASLPSGMKITGFVLLASTIIYILRDAFILHYFKFSPKNRRALVLLLNIF